MLAENHTPPQEVAQNFTYAKAARRLGIGHSTLRRWAYEGKLKVRKFSTTCVRIPLQEIERLERESFTSIATH